MGYHADDAVCEKVMIIKILFTFSTAHYTATVHIYDPCLHTWTLYKQD